MPEEHDRFHYECVVCGEVYSMQWGAVKCEFRHTVDDLRETIRAVFGRD